MDQKIKKLITTVTFLLVFLVTPTMALAANVKCMLYPNPKKEWVHLIGYKANKGYLFIQTTKGRSHNICSFATQGTKCRDLQALLTAAVLAKEPIELHYPAPYKCYVSWGGRSAHGTNVTTLGFWPGF